jgi:hypothetical protein
MQHVPQERLKMGFRIEVVYKDGNHTLIYPAKLFPVAQAVFNTLATRADNEDVRLLALATVSGRMAEWKDAVLICDKQDLKNALSAQNAAHLRNGAIIR